MTLSVLQPSDDFWPDHVDDAVLLHVGHDRDAEYCTSQCCCVATLDGLIEEEQ